jgi:hypothetical protein
MRHSSMELRRLVALTKVPCWPNPSRLTVFFTDDLRKIIGRYILGGTFFASAAAFAFATPTNSFLRLIGYNDDFVSDFPAFRSLYFYLSASRVTTTVNIADFHILDVFLWWWIAVLAIRLISGVIFLKQWDDLYQAYSLGLTQCYSRWRLFLMAVTGILLLFSPFTLTQPRLINDWKFTFLIRHYPQLYFWSVAMVYFVVGFLFVEMLLFGLWKIFRQYWPGVVLWDQNAQSEELQS